MFLRENKNPVNRFPHRAAVKGPFIEVMDLSNKSTQGKTVGDYDSWSHRQVLYITKGYTFSDL